MSSETELRSELTEARHRAHLERENAASDRLALETTRQTRDDALAESARARQELAICREQLCRVEDELRTAQSPDPVALILCCPACSVRHIDRGEFATKSHHTHACQECGVCWRPAVVATVGVQFLPGFKDP